MPGLEAIVRRHMNIPTRATMVARRDRALSAFENALINRMAKYPPQQPTKYRRSGLLGRNWRKRRDSDGNATEVVNSTPYTVYVEGPPSGAGPGFRQTAVMAGKGWQNIADESDAVMKQTKDVFVVAIRIR
jgi:hypothetical protein